MNHINPQELRELTQRIIDSGELGRSKTYAAILSYLVECSITGETPKEAAIAVDVLGREADFDVGKDSIVRVHIYHLRNKLNTYFARHGKQEKYRIEIPKGQYLLTARLNEQNQPSTEGDTGQSVTGRPLGRRALTPWLAGLAAVLLAVNLAVVTMQQESEDPGAGDPHAAVLEQGPWRNILDDQAPILVVVGDYYIFGELDQGGNVARLIREFDINSREDLNSLLMMEPDLIDRYYNLGLSYIPNGSAAALMQVMPLLHDQGRRVSLKMMSAVNASDLTSNHVIYVGYISGMGILRDLMFASSGLAVGSTYDELRNRDTGKEYISDSGIRTVGSEFKDYGMLSTFPSPRGHQIVVIAGMRDAGLANAAEEITSADSLRAIRNAVGKAEESESSEGEAGAHQSWEALFEVHGLDHTNFDGRRVYTGDLEPSRIWGGM